MLQLFASVLLLSLYSSAEAKCCSATFSPRCGPDGKRYMNECLAGLANVTVLTTCPLPPQKARGNAVCPAVFAPVCGADGRTYSNECEAEAFNVKVVASGKCEDLACPKNFSPVCGTDGWTYGNTCEANRNGATIAYNGSCPDICTDCDSDSGLPLPQPSSSAAPGLTTPTGTAPPNSLIVSGASQTRSTLFIMAFAVYYVIRLF